MAGTVLHADLVARHLHDQRRTVPASSPRPGVSPLKPAGQRPQTSADQAQFECPGAAHDHAPTENAMALPCALRADRVD